MTLDLTTLAQLVAVSGGVAVVVETVKESVRTVTTPPERWERVGLRALGLGLGTVAVCVMWEWDVVPASVGLLAGAASEVVYRWLLRELPGALDRLRGG